LFPPEVYLSSIIGTRKNCHIIHKNRRIRALRA
jgi:hypothetical protein